MAEEIFEQEKYFKSLNEANNILEKIYKDTRNTVHKLIKKTWCLLMKKSIDEKQSKKALENT